MRLVWNCAQVALGFAVSGYQLGTPLVSQHLEGPALVTGGSYGPEGGVIGLGIRVIMLVVLATVIHGRLGPWTITRPAAESPGR